MINNLRFELSFKNIPQLENQLKFCELNNITKINVPCKGVIKKEFYSESVQYLKKYHNRFNVVYHYSLFHQYSQNKENSYLEFLKFIKNFNPDKNFQILLVSGSNKKKNFDVIEVLNALKKEKSLNINFGVAYNPYLKKYYNLKGERERYKKKLSSGLVKSIWFQFGTDIKLLESEIQFLKKNYEYTRINLFGSLLIPSKQFISRFKFRPWKEVHIDDLYLYSLDNFYSFTKDLVCFYLDNNIIPVIETDFFSSKKLENLYSFFEN